MTLFSMSHGIQVYLSDNCEVINRVIMLNETVVIAGIAIIMLLMGLPRVQAREKCNAVDKVILTVWIAN